jgi:hypothetical protein
LTEIGGLIDRDKWISGLLTEIGGLIDRDKWLIDRDRWAY